MQKTIHAHELIAHLDDERWQHVLRIQSCAIKTITDYMYARWIPQVMPIMISPFTDPLNHDVHESSIEYAGQKLELTKSMIFHKQLYLSIAGIDSMYCISPNIRLEREHKGESGRHLLEFSQVDIEFKGKDKTQFMSFIEDLYRHIFKTVEKECAGSLKALGRVLPDIDRKFRVYESKDLEKKYADDFEHQTSIREKMPFWILDHTREFYDREDPQRGYYHNYDLVYPEGFGEALSGGEREYEYQEIIRKMDERQMDKGPFKDYLDIVKIGGIPPTVGAGFGVERLVRFLTGQKLITQVSPFARVPGKRIRI